MNNLMKYEFRKTLMIKLVILGITAVAEIVFLVGLALNRESVYFIGILLLSMASFASVLAIGIASVVILHRDMNTRQSYMLFMTPNSSYKILGAKVLENGLSILMTGVFFFLLAALDVSMLFARLHQLEQLWEMVTKFLRSFNENLTVDTPTLLVFTLEMLSSWISTVTAAYLAVTVSAALLNGKKLNGLLSFVLLIALNILIGWIQQEATRSVRPMQTALLVQSVIALVMAAGMYVGTARIMETRLSV